VPRLPDIDLKTGENSDPHVVILGAGASRAAFPNGDRNGQRLPLMADLVNHLGLRRVIEASGLTNISDFEAIYDEIATSRRYPALKEELESRVKSYFEVMELPGTPTIYDYLLLSLRANDYVATFNWDPLLVQAFLRNRQVATLPNILFLHGNVRIGICASDRVKGFLGERCQRCGELFQPVQLLYPVRHKNYNCDLFIANEWAELKSALRKGYLLTIFGYSAPETDVEAVDLMLRGWGQNPTFDLAEVEIADIKSEEDLRKTWERFLCRNHYGTTDDIWTTWLFRHPRRSCEAFFMATMQNDPWQSNHFPRFETLSQLHEWIAPLAGEENTGPFTGKPVSSTL